MVSATAGLFQQVWSDDLTCYELRFTCTGTTVLGAFDPLEKVADLCEKYKMWMHVDAAWGGKSHRIAAVRLNQTLIINQAVP